MNPLVLLNAYLKRLESRLRLAALLRGLSLAAAVALASTVLVALLTNWFSFSRPSMTGGRVLLFLAVAFALSFGLVLPLLRLGRRRAAHSAEKRFPHFEERLITLAEEETPGPFLELLADETLEAARDAGPGRLVPNGLLVGFASAAVAAASALIWLAVAGPGFLGYGASLLWGGTPAAGHQPFYEVVVTPGDHAVRRGANQAVTARLVGFESRNVRIFARYGSTTKWEATPMLPKEGLPAYEFLFAGIPESVQYYVDAGRLRSKTYTLSVVDLPAVKRIRVKYRFPSWLGEKDAVEDPGGDLRAVEGTEAEVSVETDRPLRNGALALDDGTEVSLNPAGGNWSSGVVKVQKDGAYFVAVRERDELVRLTDDYFIEARKDSAPSLRIVRPGRDAPVSPIEEVAVEVEGEDDFGLHGMDLHYSVNGGADKVVPLFNRKAARTASGTSTLYLEDFHLVPGDVVAIYATARDARSTSRTGIYFLEAQPFEREYMQAQAAGGSGGQGGENRISQRQKEIIAATWNQVRDRSQDRKAASENAQFLAGVQDKLRAQARSLAERMQRRELAGQNQEFQSFSGDMGKASEAMGEAVGKLKSLQWREALQPEQKALQHLLRAEAMFRRIQVAFGGGNSGAGGGMGRDLENLFDLELDTEKNQYETGRQSASSAQREQEIDEALQKLEQLARRQQELAEPRSNRQQTPQQRWQQEMLRREAEQLQRQLQQLAQGQAAQGRSSSQGGQAGAPQLEQALRRLQQATEEMRRAGAGEAESRRAAERLQEARDLMRGMRHQESSDKLDDLAREAGQLASRQRGFEGRLRESFGERTEPESGPIVRPRLTREQVQQSQRLADERQAMAEALSGLERRIQEAARDLAGSQPGVSSRLREAVGDMQQEELALRMRYNTELLRQGFGQFVRMREAPVTAGLEKLRDQLQAARSALNGSQAGGEETGRLLARIEQLRRRVEQMAPGSGGPQAGIQGGDPSGLYQGSLRDLAQLRQGLRSNPEAAREIQRLIGEMEKLAPGRFPGNPELLSRLRTQVLPALEQVELQLRRKLDEQQGGQVRTGASDPVPSGYADAVAEYFRRLSKRP